MNKLICVAILYMNIIEAYIKFKGRLIIIISGLDGSGKKKLATELSLLLNIPVLSQKSFLKPLDEIGKIKLDNYEIYNYYTDTAYDWTSLINAINKSKSTGVIVYGLSFPKQIITNYDFHVLIKITKQVCLQKRIEHFKKHSSIDPETIEKEEKLKVQRLIYPYYLKSQSNSNVTKLISGKQSFDDMYDELWDYLKSAIEKFLYKIYPISLKEKTQGNNKINYN